MFIFNIRNHIRIIINFDNQFFLMGTWMFVFNSGQNVAFFDGGMAKLFLLFTLALRWVVASRRR